MARSRVVQIVVNDWNEEQLKEFKENFKQYTEFCNNDADWFKAAVKILNSCVRAGILEKRDNFY